MKEKLIQLLDKEKLSYRINANVFIFDYAAIMLISKKKQLILSFDAQSHPIDSASFALILKELCSENDYQFILSDECFFYDSDSKTVVFGEEASELMMQKYFDSKLYLLQWERFLEKSNPEDLYSA